MSYLLQAIYETPWAILPAKLAVILEVAHRHARGERLAQSEVDAIVAASRKPTARVADVVAVLPVTGVIIPRGDLLAESSGAVSATRVAAMFRAAQADPAVGAIVLDVDSPGGSAAGIEELAREIYAARGGKSTVAVANHLAASAAYWLASAADEVWVTPSGEVGSIGVFAAHTDYSGMLEREGVRVSLISAGKYKTEANPYEPLGEEARAAVQARVDEVYGQFVEAVARGRGVPAADVRAGFGQGRVVGAREALAGGMADRIGTLEEAITRAWRLAREAGRGQISADAPADLEWRARRARHNQNLLAGSVETGSAPLSVVSDH